MKKKFISVIALVIAALIIALNVIPFISYAEEEKAEQTATPAAEEAETETAEDELGLKSEAAILVHYDSGMTIYEKNADKKLYPASTTKIMTAILAIENLSLDSVLTASETAINIDRDGSNIGILNGEQLTVEQLLCALLVHSANDAANVLAEAVSGTIEDFVVLMNKKAADLGMTGTNFANAHGYHDDNHYTTARDLSILASYAMKNAKFAEIAAIPNMELPPTAKYAEVRHLSSNNMLINPLKGSKYIYEGAKGIKTGHTEKAGYCLASMVERNGVSYICVTMNSPIDFEDNHSFKDSITLYEYAFANYKVKTISQDDEIVATAPVKWAKGGKQAILTAKEPLRLLLPADFDTNELTTSLKIPEKVKAPVNKGDTIGSIEYFYNNESLGTVELMATEDISRSFIRMVFGTIFGIIFSPWVVGTVVVLIVLLFIVRTYNIRKRRKMREMRRLKSRRDFYNNKF